MIRFLPLALAVLGSVVTLGTSVQPAFAQGSQYRAVPVVALAQADKLVAGETLWNCGPAGCTTASVTARPVIACTQVAKKLGRLESFTAAGAALSAEDLAKCNAKAKGGDTALANAN